MRALGLGLYVASALACAPDEDELDLPIDVCGQDEPVQILALEDDQVIHPVGADARYGDGWLFGVKTFEIPLTKVDTALGPQDWRPYRQIDAAIMSTGDCGEDPRVVAAGLDTIASRYRDDEPWLGCADGAWGLYWFDPTGAWPPRLVSDRLSCDQYLVIGHDVVFYGGDGELVRARLRDDGIVVDVLLDGIRSGETLEQYREEPPDDLVFVREDNAVVTVAPLTGDTTTLAEDIPSSFSISPDRRWLVWFEELEDGLRMQTWLRDLDTGIDTAIGNDEWRFVQAYVTDSFALISGWGPWISPSTEVLTLPSQGEEWIDGQVLFVDARDGQLIFRVDGELLLLDAESGERRMAEIDYDEYVDGTFFAYRPEPYETLALPEALLPWDIVGVPLETLVPETFHERVFSSVDLGGDRWIVASERDENELVELEYLDGDTLEHRPFATDVVPGSIDSRSDSSIAAPWRTDELVYQVHTRASDRTGVWRVRFGAP